MPTASTIESVTIGARLDRIPEPTRTHWMILYLLAALGLFDAFDLLIFGYTAPAIRVDLGLPIEAVGYIGSAAFFGSFIGAIAGGVLADKFGRRPILLLGVFVYSLGSGLAALSANVDMLLAARFVTGLGAQAVIIVSMIYIVEMFPTQMRGRFVSLYIGIVGPAAALAAVSSLIIVPMGPGHWRVVYAIGTAGIFVAMIAWRWLPESVRWQAQRGRTAAALATLTSFEKEAVARTGKPLPEPIEQPSPIRAHRLPLRELMSRKIIKRVVVLIGAMILFAFVFYGFNTWLTTLLVERGYTQKQALTATVIITLANVLASFAFAPFADRFERKTTVFLMAMAIASLLLMFGLINSLPVTMVSGFLLSGILQITSTTLSTYGPEIFPIHLRGLGVGIGGAAARLSAASGSIIIALVLSTFGFSAVFIFFAVVAMSLGAGFILLGEPTKGRGLEDVATDSESSHALVPAAASVAPVGGGNQEA